MTPFRTIADLVVGVDYALQIPAYGGRPPYTLTLASGSSFPDGLSANARGQIAGKPTTAGSYPLDVTIHDSSGQSIGVHLTLVVLDASAHTALAINAPPLPTFGQGQDIGYRPQAAGAGQPWTFDVSGLPPGLAFDPNTGTISGKTSATGTSPVTISAMDASGTAASGSPVALSLTVLSPQSPSGGVENWTIFRPDGAPASVTIHGGAISQTSGSAWTVRDNTGACSYEVPISGQVSGDQWSFSANGGGCNGYMTQCHAQGTTTSPGAASGSVTCTTKVPGLPDDTLTGDWTASRR